MGVPSSSGAASSGPLLPALPHSAVRAAARTHMQPPALRRDEPPHNTSPWSAAGAASPTCTGAVWSARARRTCVELAAGTALPQAGSAALPSKHRRSCARMLPTSARVHPEADKQARAGRDVLHAWCSQRQRSKRRRLLNLEWPAAIHDGRWPTEIGHPTYFQIVIDCSVKR